jgi:hypothetical protein
VNDTSVIVIFAIALMSVDLVNAFFVFRLNRRVVAMEAGLRQCGTCGDFVLGANSGTAATLVTLTEIVARHTEEITMLRKVSNENQTEILKAIHGIHTEVMKSIEHRFMSKATLEAALRDLYNRTSGRDPDAEPRVDADVP